MRYVILTALVIFTFDSIAQTLNNNGAGLQVSDGGTLYINGSFNNASGSNLQNNGTITATGNVSNFQVMTEANAGTLRFEGNAAQTLSGAGTYLAKEVFIDNPAGVSLEIPLKVSGEITFANGIVTVADPANALILTVDGTLSGVSDASHVDGYVAKEGTGEFTFPVGDGIKYKPVLVTLTDNASGIRAKYIAGDAGTAAFVKTGASDIALDAYNKSEYWDISPVSTAAGNVTLFWNANPRISPSSNVKVYKVAHKTADGWANEGSASVSGNTDAGSVTSETISTWSPFTLGAIPESALPVTIISFTARHAENKAVLDWKTSSETGSSHFDIERSFDARTFERIGTLAAQGNSGIVHHYTFTDEQFGVLNAVVYYRLRAVDADGSFALSRAISLQKGLENLSAFVYPNPAAQGALVTAEMPVDASKIGMFDVAGRSIKTNISKVPGGKMQIDTRRLTPGEYLIQIETAGGSVTRKLVVQ